MKGDAWLALRYGIRAGLPPRVGAPAVIGARFLDTLDTLSEVDPLLVRWNVLDLPAREALPLAEARLRIAGIVEKNVVRDDYDQPEPASGYTAIGVVNNGEPSRDITFRVAAGAVYQGGDIMLQIGELIGPTDRRMVSYSLFRRACSRSSQPGSRRGVVRTSLRWTIGRSRLFPRHHCFPIRASIFLGSPIYLPSLLPASPYLRRYAPSARRTAVY